MSHTEPAWFRIKRWRAKQVGPEWRARATIFRADTDEPVDRVRTRAATPGAAEEQLDAAIESRLATLEKPSDWGRDPTVPRLVMDFERLGNDVYGMALQAEGRAEPEARQFLARAEAYHQAGMTKLRERVEALTEAQRVELATPTPEQLANPDDPWNLDVLAAKKRLCELIAHRSPAVQAGYEQLEKALG